MTLMYGCMGDNETVASRPGGSRAPHLGPAATVRDASWGAAAWASEQIIGSAIGRGPGDLRWRPVIQQPRYRPPDDDHAAQHVLIVGDTDSGLTFGRQVTVAVPHLHEPARVAERHRDHAQAHRPLPAAISDGQGNLSTDLFRQSPSSGSETWSPSRPGTARPIALKITPSASASRLPGANADSDAADASSSARDAESRSPPSAAHAADLALSSASCRATRSSSGRCQPLESSRQPRA